MFGQYALRFFSRNWAFRPATGKKPGFTERLRSKSGFKLLELNERYNFLKPGLRVLELGAGRGGWTEVIVKCVKSTPANPLVLAVDIKSHPTVEGAEMIIADVSEEDSYTQIMTALKHPVDVLLSDLSDGVFGDRDLDCIVSCSHCFDALRVANVTLKPGGFMLIRMLTGANEQEQFEKMQNYFKTVEKVKPTASAGVTREVFYLSYGWKLNKPPEKEVTKDILKETVEKAYASGAKFDPDIEALIRKEIGEFDKDNPKYAYLKDEDSAFEHLRQGKEPLSFQQKVPENYEEMEKMVEEHKKTGAHANRENEDYEEEEAEYEKRVDLDLQSYIDQINSEPMEHAAKAYEDKESEGHDFMEKYGFPDFNFGTELNNKERVRKYQKGKKEATHEHSRWEEAMKDSEFWKN